MSSRRLAVLLALAPAAVAAATLAAGRDARADARGPGPASRTPEALLAAATPVGPPAAPAPAPSPPPWAACPDLVDDVPGIQARAGDGRLDRDVLVVSKGLRRAMLYEKGRLARGNGGTPVCHRIALGYRAPEGPKRARGDMRTPEGWYRMSDKPWSWTWPGSIAVHYPNLDDARRAHRERRLTRRELVAIGTAVTGGRRPPQRTALGGDILLHGGGSAVDWTDGCIAFDDHDLRALRRALEGRRRVSLLILP